MKTETITLEDEECHRILNGKEIIWILSKDMKAGDEIVVRLWR